MWDDAVRPFTPEECEAQEGMERISDEDREEFAEEGAKVSIVRMENPPPKQEFDEHMHMQRWRQVFVLSRQRSP